jgi:parallel beta-helix repeat protein
MKFKSYILLICFICLAKIVLSNGDMKYSLNNDNEKLQNIINQAITSNKPATLPSGKFIISKPLVINQNIIITANPNCSITQSSINTQIFIAKNLTKINISNINFYGCGLYNSKRKGSTSIMDRGIDLYGCENVTIENCKFYNIPFTAIYITGGKNITIENNYIEGTHLKGTKLKMLDNYQFGINLSVLDKFNSLENITITNNEICYTNQGIITSQGKTGTALQIVIANNFIHHIIGQHGLYISTSNTTIENNKVEWAGLEGIKIQAAHCNLENIIIKKNNVKNCVNSQAFNITEINNGLNKITNVKLIDCSAYNCARGINLSGRLDNILIKNITIDSTSKQYGLCIQTEMANNILFDSIKIKRTKQAPIFIVSKQNQKIEFKNININSKNSPSIDIKSGDNLMFENIFVNSKMIDIKNFIKIASINKKVMNLTINKIKIN